MAVPGQVISAAMSNRWAFEALGRGLHIGAIDGAGPGLASYADAFTGSASTGLVVLASLGVVFAAATVAVLSARTRRW
jgi:hypothetical protein